MFQFLIGTIQTENTSGVAMTVNRSGFNLIGTIKTSITITAYAGNPNGFQFLIGTITPQNPCNIKLQFVLFKALKIAILTSVYHTTIALVAFFKLH